METSKVIPLFPSLVWKTQLEAGLRDTLNTSIVAALADMRRQLPPLEAGDGWQSAHALHRRDELREFVSWAERGVTRILRSPAGGRIDGREQRSGRLPGA